MSHLDQDPRSDPDRGVTQTGREAHPASDRASIRQAVWSAVTAVAMIFVLFVVFYGINAQRDATIAARTRATGGPTLSSSSSSPALAPPALQTTGQDSGRNAQGDR